VTWHEIAQCDSATLLAAAARLNVPESQTQIQRLSTLTKHEGSAMLYLLDFRAEYPVTTAQWQLRSPSAQEAPSIRHEDKVAIVAPLNLSVPNVALISGAARPSTSCSTMTVRDLAGTAVERRLGTAGRSSIVSL
jgi:hypothetical protein